MRKWTGCPIIACKNDLCSERCMFDVQHAVGFRDGYEKAYAEIERLRNQCEARAEWGIKLAAAEVEIERLHAALNTAEQTK